MKQLLFIFLLAGCGQRPIYDLDISPTMQRKFAERQAALAALPEFTSIVPEAFEAPGEFEFYSHEQVNWLFVPRDHVKPVSVYSWEFLNVIQGDILHFDFHGTVDDDTGYNVFLSQHLCLASGPTSEECLFQIGKGSGENVTPAEHHHIWRESLTYKFTEDHPSVFLNLVAHAASYGWPPNRRLKVNQGSGSMTGWISRL